MTFQGKDFLIPQTMQMRKTSEVNVADCLEGNGLAV